MRSAAPISQTSAFVTRRHCAPDQALALDHRAAQQLAEADPAGWAIGRVAWPEVMRENTWEAARFGRAASVDPVRPLDRRSPPTS